MNKCKIYLRSILVPVLVGIIVGLIISPFMDYNSLNKPFLSPPGTIFPIMWIILYVLMGISYGILDEHNVIDGDVKKIYYIQLFFNALWSIAFFVLKFRLFAFIWILALDFLVLIMVMRFYNKNKLAGLLQIPYLLWILFASYLNIAFYLLNK